MRPSPAGTASTTYVFWRPITAIQLADTDGNPATDPDPSWTPLLVTPNFPEYPSAHATVSPAAAVVLQSVFGDSGPYTLDSEILPGVLHSFTSFAGAADEAFVARIYGGIHFRTSCQDGHDLGLAVGNFIVANAALPDINPVPVQIIPAQREREGQGGTAAPAAYLNLVLQRTRPRSTG